MRAALEGEGLGAPADILAWFGWQDGCERMGLVVLPPPRFWVMSLDQALDERRSLLAFAQETAAVMRDAGDVKEMEDPAYWWRESWLPIGKHGGGDCLIADLAPGERDFAPLRTWAAEAPDEAHELAAPSLSAAVSYWIAALESGCCRWAAEHEYPHWEIDPVRQPPRPPGLSPFLG